MAKGRMILKSVVSDRRLWDQMSDNARWAFLLCIPSIESDGTLPRDPRTLRIMCFPIMKIDDHGTEKIIREWLKTTPPIVVQEGDSLRFTEFQKCNSGLQSNRDRQRKFRDKKRSNYNNNYSESNADVTLRNACNVRSEVKGSEEKRSKTSIAASQPQDSTAKPLSSVQKIVNAYKISRGIPKDDKSWDKANFSRYSKSAKAMLECFGGDVQKSVAYVLLKADQFREKGLEYTLETLARHAYDAKGGREEVPDEDVKKIEGGKNHAIPAVTLDEHRLLESRPGGGTSQAGEDGPEAWD